MRKYIIASITSLVFVASAGATVDLDTVPQTQAIGHLNTAWEDFKTISPSTNIPFMVPPTASATGDANIDFPLTIPAGRNDIHPQLKIGYSIEGGTTWLGTGWNLSLSSFTLDTRWGVPLYDDAIESEIYLFDGEQMGPVFHRSAEYEREAEREFHMRQELQFRNIIRHGDSPRNYWWEVRSKDGMVSYYGGSPSTGFSTDYALLTPQGNITEWYLSETRDVYDNFTKYHYQKVTYKGGTSVYPQSITYNGRGSTEGNYRIDFTLTPRGAESVRRDIVTNCRTGMKYTMADMLANISIYYNDQKIRSYRFDYAEGKFFKQLLQSISEYDQMDELFYTYDFDYYDDVQGDDTNYPLFGAVHNWSVAKDNIEVNAVTATAIADFLEPPTILGGAKSWNIGGGLAVTIGLVGNLASKENTVGANGGASTSNGTGIIALVDINGDGLPDKVWKENGELYYRANLSTQQGGSKGFAAQKVKIKGIKDFSLSNTVSWNVGGELNLGIGVVGGFVGYSHEENTTRISTYFADFNGDELIDIAHNEKVYFNTLDADGHPTFTLSSEATPSPIYKGAALDPGLIEVDPDAQAQAEEQNPLHDAVRLWRVQKSGTITITGDIQLIEATNADTQNLPNKDGVAVSIQLNENNLYRQVIAAGDYTAKSPIGVSNISVARGDSLFFRVHSVYNGYSDEVLWDPIITYTNEDITKTDVNKLPENIYRASADFLVNTNVNDVLSADGLVSISGPFVKPALTDTIYLRSTGAIQFDTAFAPSTVVDGDFVIDNIPVLANSEYKFSIYSRSNVDWTQIAWSPMVVYTAFADGSSATTASGDPLISTCANVYKQSYNRVYQYGAPYIAADSGRVEVKAVTNLGLSQVDAAHFALKSLAKPDSVACESDIPTIIADTIRLSMQVEAGDTLYADLHTEGTPFFGSFDVPYCTFTLNGNTENVACGSYLNNPDQDVSSGHLYRGWCQFAYNANDGRGQIPILTTALEIDDEELEGDTTLINDETDPDGVGTSIVTLDDLFLVMRSDPKGLAWRGSDPLTFVTSTTMASSRNGRQDISPPIPGQGGGADFEAMILETWSKSDAVAAGGSVGVVNGGGGVTFGVTKSILDVTDMNGDRFPDIISENKIQYTNQRGGLSDSTLVHGWGTHEAKSFAYGGGVGGSYVSTSAKNSGGSPGKGSNKSTARVKQKSKSKLRGSTNAYKTSKGSIGVSANYTVDGDSTLHTFLDINGDGLEDKIWNGGDVALNMGYSFAPVENWGFDQIRWGDASDFGAGAGYNYANGSIMAGLAAARTENSSELGFTDVNNDAFIDLIVSTSPMEVRFNTGEGFSDPIKIDDSGEMDKGVSIGESLNVAGTVCIPFLFIKVCFNVSASSGQGTSSVGRAFTDIDGDGYIDLLTASGDDSQLQVRPSTIGRTNLLSTYSTPLGGEVVLDYKLAGSTQDTPFSKWVYAGVTIDDGVVGDGVDIYRKSFDYEGPYYHRNERHFYGFETVHEYELDDEQNVLREIESQYQNRDTYTKGLIKYQAIKDGDGTAHQYINYEYILRDVESGIPLAPNYVQRDDGMAFPSLATKTIYITEGSQEAIVRTYTFDYDTYGNILESTDVDQSGYAVKAINTYDYRPDIYLMNLEESKQILGNGTLYRSTTYVRDDVGNILEEINQIDDGNFAVTVRTYDEYGNIRSIINPQNRDGESMTYAFTYDEAEHQYMVHQLDGYGSEQSFEYDYLYNELLSSTDINGNSTEYRLDEKGRPFSITYPRELAAGQPFSLSFDYVLAPSGNVGLVRHWDEATESVNFMLDFEDGLFRSIQQKVLGNVFEGNSSSNVYIVSGTDKHDFLGRYAARYRPLTEGLNQPTVLNGDSTTVRPTRITYDVFDRPTRIEDTFGAATTFVYGIGQARDGNQYLTTHTNNANGHTKTEFYNARGDLVAERLDGPAGDIWRTYEYDGFGQVVNITDPLDNVTTYTYDLLGRRTSVKVPDAGLTELKYDNAGNLTEKITATIRDEINEDGSIRYTYDKERLVQIDYPKHFQNKVQIHYGSPQDSFNRVGRIWLQEDATGGREYFFDANGNPIKTIRTVMINRTNVFTYVSEAEYDTWDRVLSYTYPDGEVLTYNYHIGGQLASMTGEKAGRTYNYLTDAKYDELIDTRVLEYGNDTRELFTYDNKRRLKTKQFFLGDNTLSSDESYEYDVVDNLKLRTNTADGSTTMGGAHDEVYDYDLLNRLTKVDGNWSKRDTSESYHLAYMYDDLDNLSFKDQSLSKSTMPDTTLRTYLDYSYEYDDQPRRPSTVGDRQYQYDANGNLKLSETKEELQDSLGLHYDQNLFDEENRIIGVSDNGYVSRYTYDAFGRRALKSHGDMQVIFINGAPAGYIEHSKNFKADISPYFTVYENDYRKHFFVGNRRIATKIGTGVFQSTLGYGPELTAGSIDYKSRISQYENSILEYYASLGVPPGPPGLLAINGQPEFNGLGLPDATADNPYNLPPTNWPNLTPPDTTGPPGAPIFYEFAGITNENVEAGYNFSAGGITAEAEQFFFQYDHSGSTQYITDMIGNPRQYAFCLPSGETWIEQTTTTDITNLRWQGLTFDPETGMYNMGNVYYDPETNVEQSIDPVLLHFGESTFLNRPEGSLYYDFAVTEDNNDDEKFDIQILNAEKPHPFTGASANTIDGKSKSETSYLGPKYKHIVKAFGGKPGWNATAANVDKSAKFGTVISELAPHMALVDITDNAELQKLAHQVLIKDKKTKLKKKIKAFFKGKEPAAAPKPKSKKSGRKVRFM